MDFEVGQVIEYDYLPGYPPQRAEIVEIQIVFKCVKRYWVQPYPVRNCAGQWLSLRRLALYPTQMRYVSDLELLSCALEAP